MAMEISRGSPAGLRNNANTQHGWRDASVRAADFRDPARVLPVTVTGAHGGAGTTTVARLLGARDAGRHWPQPGEEKYPPRILLVARTHAAGLMAVSQVLARYFASGRSRGPYLTGIVLVPDAPGRIPKPLKRRITVLESATMIHRLPWVAAWRLTENTADPRIAESLRAFAERASLTTTPALSEGEACD
jgi:hypothetical protein